jgi:hypothetical protein
MAKERQSDAFLALKKALGYTLSLVVAALPGIGFEYCGSSRPSTTWTSGDRQGEPQQKPAPGAVSRDGAAYPAQVG